MSTVQSAPAVEHQDVASYAQRYKTFLADFFEKYEGEICPDEGSSVQAWHPLTVDFLSQLEHVFSSLMESYWQAQPFDVQWAYSRKLDSRRQTFRDLQLCLTDRRTRPQHRFNDAKQLLSLLKDDDILNEFANAAASTESLHELWPELVDLLQYEMYRLSGLYKYQLDRAVENLDRFLDRFPRTDGGGWDFKTLDFYAEQDKLGSLVRQVCLPSRNLNLLHKAAVAFEGTEETKLRLRESHAVLGDWVIPLLAAVPDLKQPGDEFDRLRRMLTSISERRDGLSTQVV